MQIYETEQVETFLKDVEEFFENLDSAKKKMSKMIIYTNWSLQN